MTYSLYDHDENVGPLPTSYLGPTVPDLRVSSGQLDDAGQGSSITDTDDISSRSGWTSNTNSPLRGQISSGLTSNTNSPLIGQVTPIIAMRRPILEHICMNNETSPCHGEKHHLQAQLSVPSYTQHAKAARKFGLLLVYLICV